MHILFCAHSWILTYFWGVLNFRPKMLRWCLVCVSCNSNRFHFFIFKCSNIGDVHLSSCAYLKLFSHFWWVFNLDIFRSEMRRGCLICVICNYNSFHSFIFKLCIMIFHSSSYFIHISWFFFQFLGGGGKGVRHFFRKILRGCLVCVICNSNSFHSLMLKLAI